MLIYIQIYRFKIRCAAYFSEQRRWGGAGQESPADITVEQFAHTPLQRLGEPGDIAGAVLYFEAPVSSWVGGQVLFVNGGGVQTLD